MLNRNKKLTTDGFTIIEVVIVLAIAALILLIVLLAVPALQRNSRSNAIKHDASAIAAGLSDFESNNSGQFPTKISKFDSGTLTFANGSITNGATAKIQDTDKVNYRKSGSTNINFWTFVPPPFIASTGEIDIVTGKTCPDKDGNTTKSTHAFSVYYWTETPGLASGKVKGLPNGSGLKAQCLDT